MRFYFVLNAGVIFMGCEMFETINYIIDHPINKKRKIRALADYAKWQIRSRITKKDNVFNWIEGSKLIIRSGERGLTGNLYCGLHDFKDMTYLLHVLRGNDLFIDVGANSGAYTVLACSVVGAKGYAFEPVPGTFYRLRHNVVINGINDRVTTMNIGISDYEGVAKFTEDNDWANCVIPEGQKVNGGVDVDVKKLDDIIEIKTPAMLKIDVEGYEKKVLLGAQDLLKNDSLHSVIIEINKECIKYGCGENEIIDMLMGYGFTNNVNMILSKERSSLSKTQ